MKIIHKVKQPLRYQRQPYCFGGGGGSSQANTSTATTTTTSTNMLDQSMMGGDDAVGLNGNGNMVDKSVINNTAFNDTSNRSTNFSDASNRSTNFTDNSARDSGNSTVFTDNSNRSTYTSVTATDFGSVGKSLDGMSQLSALAVGNYGQIVKDGQAGLLTQGANNLSLMQKAFDFAGSSSAADAQKYADVIGFAKTTIDQANDAFATAKDGGETKKFTIVAATVAAVGIAFALSR